MIKVVWTGAAGLQFHNAKTAILVDPYYTRINFVSTLLSSITPDAVAVDIMVPHPEQVKAIIVGHTHSDHALDVPYIMRRSYAKLIGSQSMDALMSISGQPGRTTVCKGGETVALGESAAVTMIRSTHGLVAMGKVPFPGEIRPTGTLPMKASGYRVGTAFAPKIQMQGMTFLHFGSANFIDEEIAGHTCDILFLCVPGWKKRQGYPENLISMTQAQTVVLIHWDDFSKPRVKGKKTRQMPFVDLEGMIQQIKDHCPEVNILVPEVGEVMAFG